MTLRDTINATFSPASAAGLSPCGWRDGQTTDQCGPGHAHVSRFRSQDAGAASPTTATSGQRGFASSRSADLQRSLESKLRVRGFGSTRFSMTWRVSVTPAQRQICRLHASALRTLGSDCGLWPTPRASRGGPDYAKRRRSRTGINLATAVGGMPNPKWIAWLMGYPEQWNNAAPTATPSCRGLQWSLF